MALNVPVRHMPMPQGGKPPVHLMGFDYGQHLFHLLAFDFGDDGGAVGIWREGDKFCARISLDALAEFWRQANNDKAGAPDAGRQLHRAALSVVEGLMHGDPAKDSPQGKALEQLAAAVEAYERATLPPPFGNAGGTMREVPVTLEQIEELARTMWKGAPVPGRVLRFGAAVLGLADAAAVPVSNGRVGEVRAPGVRASGEALRAATRAEVLSDVDPVALECWKLQGRKVGAMLADAQAAVIELREKLEDAAGVALPRPIEPPREFWNLLHEWSGSKDEERRDAIEQRFGELFALAASGVPGLRRAEDLTPAEVAEAIAIGEVLSVKGDHTHAEYAAGLDDGVASLARRVLPLLEAVAAGKNCSQAAGDLMREFRAASGVALPAAVQPKIDDDALLIDNLFRATLGGDSMAIDAARMALRQRMNELRTAGVAPVEASSYTYASTQATNCARCGKHKHTPLRVDKMDGYVRLTCIDQELERLLDAEAAVEAAPLSEWHEDVGPVVWWAFPVNEPAWIGSPTDSDWPGYHTHWTPHPPAPTGGVALPRAGQPTGGA